MCLVNNSDIVRRKCLDVGMSKQREKFVLSSVEEERLRQLIRAQSTPQGLAQRARVVQLAAQGMGVRAIGEQVGMHFNQVAKWRRRYLRAGLGALQDEPRSGRKGSIGTEVLRQIFDQATRPSQGRGRSTWRAPGVSHRVAGRHPASSLGRSKSRN